SLARRLARRLAIPWGSVYRPRRRRLYRCKIETDMRSGLWSWPVLVFALGCGGGGGGVGGGGAGGSSGSSGNGGTGASGGNGGSGGSAGCMAGTGSAIAAELAVDFDESGGDLNGVLDPGEQAAIEPGWSSAAGVTCVSGTIANFTGPAGAT